MPDESLEVLKGTLDMLVLQVLAAEPAHGYAVTRRLEALTDGSLSIDEGSMYPALYRMQKRGWITSQWRRSDRGRRAKVYELTEEGHRQLDREARYWHAFSEAVGQVMSGSPDRAPAPEAG